MDGKDRKALLETINEMEGRDDNLRVNGQEMIAVPTVWWGDLTNVLEDPRDDELQLPGLSFETFDMSVAEPWFVSIAIWNTVENLVKFDGTPKKARMLNETTMEESLVRFNLAYRSTSLYIELTAAVSLEKLHQEVLSALSPTEDVIIEETTAGQFSAAVKVPKDARQTIADRFPGLAVVNLKVSKIANLLVSGVAPAQAASMSPAALRSRAVATKHVKHAAVKSPRQPVAGKSVPNYICDQKPGLSFDHLTNSLKSTTIHEASLGSNNLGSFISASSSNNNSLSYNVGLWNKPGSWNSVSTWKPKFLEPGLVGLNNMGNTCYVNAGLQCLAHLRCMHEFAALPRPMQGRLAPSFHDLMKDLWKNPPNKDEIRPYSVVRAIEASNIFERGQQHDSSELILLLLDWMSEDTKSTSSSAVAGFSGIRESASSVWEEYRKMNQSFVTDTFGWLLKSELKCLECGEVSHKYDPSLQLPLNVPSPPPVLVTILLCQDFKFYSIQMEVTFQCTMAKVVAKAAAQMDISPDDAFGLGFNAEDHKTWLFSANFHVYFYCQKKKRNIIVYDCSRTLEGVPFATVVLESSLPVEGGLINILPMVVSVPCNRSLRSSVHQVVNDWMGPNLKPLEPIKLGGHTPELRDFYFLKPSPESAMRSMSWYPEPDVYGVAIVWELGTLSHFWTNEFPRPRPLVLDDAAKKAMAEFLERPEKEVATVASCLKQFVAEETLSVSEMWMCKNCKVHRAAKKTISLQSLPRVFIVQLKRFEFSEGVHQKINTFVDYSFDLDLSDFSEEKKEYSLVGVVKHKGKSLGNGHYIACCRLDNNEWYEFNDNMVRKIDRNQVVSDEAFVLFYEEKEPEKASNNESELEEQPTQEMAMDLGEDDDVENEEVRVILDYGDGQKDERGEADTKRAKKEDKKDEAADVDTVVGNAASIDIVSD